jgi:hypothetical protein
MKNTLKLFVLSSIFFLSCSGNSSDSNQNSDPSSTPSSAVSDNCNCSTSDANRLAYKMIKEYTQIQNQLPSEMARVMSQQSVEKQDGCSWKVTFKIAWPFGNTDGAHPDEYVTRTFMCNGSEIYAL